MKKYKLFSRILLLVILIYGFVFASLFLSLSYSLFRTLNGIIIPDDFFLVSLVPSDPLLRVSYKIPNQGVSEISDLKIDFKVSINYYENFNNSERKEEIFFKSESIKRINPLKTYKAFIEGGLEYFNTSQILAFWNNANLSMPVFYLLSIKISGRYGFGTIPFKIIIDEFNPECPSCT
jgi:hypothetical protein